MSTSVTSLFKDNFNDTQVKILDAAIYCFQTWGIEKTSLSDIAKQAGVTRPTVYAYFKSRDEILRTAILSSAYLFTDKIIHHISKFKKLEDRLVEAVIFVVESLANEPYLQFIIDSDMSEQINAETFNDPESLHLTLRVFEEIYKGYQLQGQDLQGDIEFSMRITLSLLNIKGEFNRDRKALRHFLQTRFLPGLGLSGKKALKPPRLKK